MNMEPAPHSRSHPSYPGRQPPGGHMRDTMGAINPRHSDPSGCRHPTAGKPVAAGAFILKCLIINGSQLGPISWVAELR
jgi:hypothetical protein